MISIVVAIDEKRGIGKNGDLLFKIPQDFKRMKTITMGKPLIMGRKTHESIGRVLPGRQNIIITRDADYKVEGATIVHSLDEALEIATSLSAPRNDNEEAIIFGGGQIFKEALEKNLVDRLYITLVVGDYGADTFFPDYSAFTKVVEEVKGEYEQYTYTFLTLEK